MRWQQFALAATCALLLLGSGFSQGTENDADSDRYTVTLCDLTACICGLVVYFYTPATRSLLEVTAKPRFRSRIRSRRNDDQAASSSSEASQSETPKQAIIVMDLPPPGVGVTSGLPPAPVSGFVNPFMPLRAR